MKRTPLRRYTPLRSRTKLRAVNAERQAHLYERNFGSYSDVIRMMPCLVCDRQPVEAHHTTSRGAGGDRSTLIPLCRRCHALLHTMGRQSFEARFSIDLEALYRRSPRRTRNLNRRDSEYTSTAPRWSVHRAVPRRRGGSLCAS